MREADLAKPVADWMRSSGYTVYSEVPLGIGSFRTIDLVGRRSAELLCVELKRSLTRAVFQQAHILQLVTPYVYVAVGTSPRRSSIALCARHGLGVLSISGDVKVVLMPRRIMEPFTNYRQKMLEGLSVMKPSDEAGNPTLLGVGPAIETEIAVREYRNRHPGARWNEIWENVPNQYASPRSMAGGMRQLASREWRKQRKEMP